MKLCTWGFACEFIQYFSLLHPQNVVYNIVPKVLGRVMRLYRNVDYHDCVVVYLGFCLLIHSGVTELLPLTSSGAASV